MKTSHRCLHKEITAWKQNLLQTAVSEALQSFSINSHCDAIVVEDHNGDRQLVPTSQGQHAEGLPQKVTQQHYSVLIHILPANGFNLHAREAKCTVTLNTNHAGAWRVILAPHSSCYHKAQSHTHCPECACIQPTHTIVYKGEMDRNVSDFAESAENMKSNLFLGKKLGSMVRPMSIVFDPSLTIMQSLGTASFIFQHIPIYHVISKKKNLFL